MPRRLRALLPFLPVPAQLERIRNRSHRASVRSCHYPRRLRHLQEVQPVRPYRAFRPPQGIQRVRLLQPRSCNSFHHRQLEPHEEHEWPRDERTGLGERRLGCGRTLPENYDLLVGPCENRKSFQIQQLAISNRSYRKPLCFPFYLLFSSALTVNNITICFRK